MDDIFQQLPVNPNFKKENLRPYEDKIIKRIPKILNSENEQKLKHPKNEYDFANSIKDAQNINKQLAENIVTVHETQETNDYYYIIMERCKESIQDEIKRIDTKIKQNSMQIMDCLYQIFKGYKCLQSINSDFIHRDLTIDNLLIQLIDGRMVIKIADFGISKLDKTIVDTSRINQKLNFLAPEFKEYSSKIKGQKKYTNQVDIYSLGICLYQMMYNDDVQIDTDQGKIDIDNKVQNKLTRLIIDMTKQNYENRLNWDDLYCRIIHDHVIFHCEDYYKLIGENYDQGIQYDKQYFLRYANLIINHYKTVEGGVQGYKSIIRDNLLYFEQFQRIDNFIQMIQQSNENETWILIQVLLVETQRNVQELIQQTQENNYKNLEFLQIKQYFRVILQRASEELRQLELTQQQQYQIVQEIGGRSSNPEYYNYFINTQLKDVSERTCCLIM